MHSFATLKSSSEKLFKKLSAYSIAERLSQLYTVVLSRLVVWW